MLFHRAEKAVCFIESYLQFFFAFLRNKDITENIGVFVTRIRSLAQAPKGNIVRADANLSKMNPVVIAQTGGTTVTVVKGLHKVRTGIIKDTDGSIARVELRTGNTKVITI